MDNPKQKLKELYQALRDKPLDPADPHDARWYVPYVERLETDPIAEIFEEINFSESSSLHYVSGQRGTGKSTELLRLRKQLSDSGVVVLYVDMVQYLHMSEPAEISDFLIAVSAGLAEQVREKFGLIVEEETYWERLKQFVEGLKIEKALFKSSLDLAPIKFGADITARLKTDNTFKQSLQDAARGHSTGLVEQVHDFSIALVKALRDKKQNPDLQVAVIIDSFEQIRGYYGNVDEIYESVVRLFGVDGKYLQLPHTHTIITIPPYLNSISIGAGKTPVSLPSIHVRQFDSSFPDPQGIQILTNIIFQRTSSARELFTEEILFELAVASGGDIRDFFSLVSNMLIKAGTQLVPVLPLDADLARLSKEKLARSLHPIDDASTRWLYKVRETKQAELGEKDKLPALALLFDRNLVIHYQNGTHWYGIHPLIDDYVVKRMEILNEREVDD